LHTQILHLSGPGRGRLESIPRDVVRIGSASESEVLIPGVAAHHAEVHYRPEECSFHLYARGGTVFVNGQQVREVILDHGDLLELGAGGPKLRFRIHAEKGEYCKPVRSMFADARDHRELHGLLAWVASLLRDLHHRTSLATKIAFPLLVAALAFFAAWGGQRVGAREANRLIAELVARQELLVRRDEIDSLRESFDQRARILDRLAEQNAALKRVLATYTEGVCLLHGELTFELEADGSVQPLLGPDGSPAAVEYTGSGFLASADGHVVTNRHVVEPWWRDEDLRRITQLGYRPRFLRFEAVFPGRDPLPVLTGSVRTRSDDVDVAVVRVEIQGIDPLPLHDGDLRPLEGERVVVIGYPTGVNALLAKADPVIVREVTGQANSLTELIRLLAARRAITPVVTQGALGEVFEHQLVYDASTTTGGSGGPVFGPDGRVIAVNFAILSQFGGTNFGVPIRFARELLP
jgi:S1-C subfamily serine protease